MDYNCIITMVKRTNLLEYLKNNLEECATKYNLDIHSVGAMEYLRQMYAKERDVRLIIMVRYDGHKTFCKIKCPINPMPVKGWFEVPTVRALSRYLSDMGWCERECIGAGLLK